MEKQLIIHVGTPKTGSTTFQNFMMDNHCTLQDHGVFFPFDPKFFNPEYHQSQFIPPAHSEILLEWLDFQRDYPFLGVKWCDAFQRFREDPKLHTMVVSHESLSMLSWRFKPEAFATWTRGLNPNFLIVIRHPLDFLASRFKEAVIGSQHFSKPPGSHPSFMRYKQGGYRDIVERLGQIAPTSVLSYDSLKQNNLLIQQMLKVTNVPEHLANTYNQKFANTKRVNIETLILISYLNTFHNAPELRTRLLNSAESSNELEPLRPDQLYSRDTRDAILEIWEEDKTYLKKTFHFNVPKKEHFRGTLEHYRLTSVQVDQLTSRFNNLEPEYTHLLKRALALAELGNLS